MNEQQLTGEDEDLYKQIKKATQSPVTSKEQLGQILLKTFHRTADPDTVEFKKIKHLFPVIKREVVIDEKSGEHVEVGVLTGWKEKEIVIPIRKQSEYREFISDDISRGFLHKSDYELYQDIGSYCETIRSFAKRYDLNLSKHHNHLVNEVAIMVVGSGAVEGQKPILAKTDIAKNVQGYETIQAFQKTEKTGTDKIIEEALKRL